MLRSDVNQILQDADRFIRNHGFVLPPFAYWRPKEMVQRGAGALRERAMGWDITDYGEGRFDELGLVLFTVRNGLASDLSAGRGMVYAEKIMISRKDQLSPMHRHIIKSEDIINRGGGTLVLELFERDEEGGIDRNADVVVPVDGEMVRLSAGAHLALEPGQSVTLHPNMWHAFWGEGSDVLIGEVSTVNDDRTDNIFEMPIGRFSTIEEDREPLHLLVSDYDEWMGQT